MKVTDYIIEFLQNKGIQHIFGYPGGVICHLMDSVSKYNHITSHITYNEQGAAFAACGYAQSSHKIGVAFSTSGPGATNLLTGIANAYFDSIPTLFITGQVDTYALSEGYPVRQRGFQETDVVQMVKPITKYAVRVDNPQSIKVCLERAYYVAFDGNPGPVLLDIPADVQRADIDIDTVDSFKIPRKGNICNEEIDKLITIALAEAKRPVFLLGNGVKLADAKESIKAIIERFNIPTVTSLPAFDILPFEHPNYFGFIGTNGQRYANFVIGKSDLIIALGTRFDIRQIGLKREKFVPSTKIVRIDIDSNQLKYKVHNDEIDFQADIKDILPLLSNVSVDKNWCEWNLVCEKIKFKLIGYDDEEYNKYFTDISKIIDLKAEITLDVGQNQIWFAQSAHLNGQNVYMSSGHGSMGYSLPAALGVYYGTGKDVYCFTGDGGLMMNLQELQFLKREKLPIKIVCFNNKALGMIRGFQERNFDKNYTLTTENSGYETADFKKVADAFDIDYILIHSREQLKSLKNLSNKPAFIEISYPDETNLIPNFGRNGLIQDQMPYLQRDIFDELMEL